MQTITVFYDPNRLDWDEAIERELRRRGLKPGKAHIVAYPDIPEFRNDKQKKLFDD